MIVRQESRLGVPAIQPILDGRERHLCYGAFPPAVMTVIETALTRDRSMRLHLLAVNKMAHIWGGQLGLSSTDREIFMRAALLHDVGKVLIPDSILLKPEKLSSDEFQQMKEHVPLGVALVAGVCPDLSIEAAIVGQHHERFDGQGYPNGLRGEEIHHLARAMAVIDAYSAMTDERPYTKTKTREEALVELERCAGTQFDPEFVASFVFMKRERAPRSIYGSGC